MNTSIVNGTVTSIGLPGFLDCLNPFVYRNWSIKFICGNCKIESKVVHDEAKQWHKCPVCEAINKLDKTSYYDF